MILPVSRPDDKAAILQAVEQAGDVRNPRDHTVRYPPAGQPVKLGPAEDPQSIVLGGGGPSVSALPLSALGHNYGDVFSGGVLPSGREW
jgi:hypothetical protein